MELKIGKASTMLKLDVAIENFVPNYYCVLLNTEMFCRIEEVFAGRSGLCRTLKQSAGC
jgi:hypothetical protein